MACALGDKTTNLRKAERLAKEAAGKGAKLVLFPEMMPAGHSLDERIWDSAEPLNGPTVAWLKQISVRLGAYVGTTFLEVDGPHFYDAFVLTGPDGSICARVRKNPPASFEA